MDIFSKLKNDNSFVKNSNSERTVPKSLKDCYETNSVSDRLWRWANWLEVWGSRLFVILIILGIISTIGQAIQIADIDEDWVFLTVITSLGSWVFYAFIEYGAYNILALLVAALAKIVQNTNITANVALYTANDEKTFTTPSTVPQTQNKWTCPNCGALNKESSTYCNKCGLTKHK